MADLELVARMRARDAAALGEVYDTYADRLFSYATGLLGGDRDSAGDAVTDSLLLGYDRIEQLRDPNRLRPWLYAITRSECLRRHRAQSRLVAFDEGHDVIAEEIDPTKGVQRDEAAELVATSLASLNEPDREVLDLVLRHDLDTKAVAAVLGISDKHVGARISRARGQFEKAVVSVMFVRTKGRSCEELRTIVNSDAALVPGLLRKRVSRHVDDCRNCNRQRPAMIAAIPSLGVLPFLASPTTLRDALLGGDINERAAAVSEQTPAFDESGYPTQPRIDGDGSVLPPPGTPFGRNWNHKYVAVAAAVALLMAGLVGAGAVLKSRAATPALEAASNSSVPVSPEPTPTGLPVVPTPTPVAPAPTIAATPAATPAPAQPVAPKKAPAAKQAKPPAPPAAANNAPAKPNAAAPKPNTNDTAPIDSGNGVGNGGNKGDAGNGGAGGNNGGKKNKPSQGDAGDTAPKKSNKKPAATPSPQASTTPNPTPTGPPSAGAGPSSPLPPPTVSFTWADLDVGACPTTFSGEVTVTVSGGAAINAKAIWADTFTGRTGEQPLTHTNGGFAGEVSGIPTQTTVLMSVQATGQEGQVVDTNQLEISHVCPQ